MQKKLLSNAMGHYLQKCNIRIWQQNPVHARQRLFSYLKLIQTILNVPKPYHIVTKLFNRSIGDRATNFSQLKIEGCVTKYSVLH